MELSETLEVALRAVAAAARLCAAVQREDAASAVQKQDRSPVTVADLGAQAVVAHILAEARPEEPLLAEETTEVFHGPDGPTLLRRVHSYVHRLIAHSTEQSVLTWIGHSKRHSAAGRFWVLDPVDGTKGFLRGDQYAVALAQIVEGDVAVAALACPNLDWSGARRAPAGHGVVLAARRDGPAFMARLDRLEDRKPIQVSDRGLADGVRLCESVESAHTAHTLSDRVQAQLGCDVRAVRIDSQAKYALVARGDAELYLRLPTRGDYREKIWDHAAGYLILTRAGGCVTDIHGRPLDFACGKRLEANRGILATNGRIHDAVLRAVEAALAG